MSKLAVGNSPHKDLFYEITPERNLQSLVLPEKIRAQIQELAEEQHRAELLHAHNLRARNRVLLAGPPGNGKTTLAEALAFELMYPLIVIRYETLVSSYLGETSSRLKSVMDYARTQRCVLFFDEFETLGKERGDTHETGEIKRVVSTLLMQLDEMPDYVVVVAASNHPELLDKAVWRRFQLCIELATPTREQLTQYIASIGERCGVKFGYEPETLAKHLLGLNFAEAEEFCLGVVRRAVLDMKTENAQQITKLKLEQWKGRLKPRSEQGGTMTSEEMIELAQQAGWEMPTEWDADDGFLMRLERFAALVAAAEREACARMCQLLRPSKREYDHRFWDACTASAAVIRARGVSE